MVKVGSGRVRSAEPPLHRVGRRRRPARRLGPGDADHRTNHDQRAFPRPHSGRADRQPADLGVHALLPGARHLGRGRGGAARRRGRARAALRARAGARGDLFEDRAALSPHRLGADGHRQPRRGPRADQRRPLGDLRRRGAPRSRARSGIPVGAIARWFDASSSGAWPRIASPPEAGPGASAATKGGRMDLSTDQARAWARLEARCGRRRRPAGGLAAFRRRGRSRSSRCSAAPARGRRCCWRGWSRR